jgi:aspartate/tyrosine/aromatic aminotransferase
VRRDLCVNGEDGVDVVEDVVEDEEVWSEWKKEAMGARNRE